VVRANDGLHQQQDRVQPRYPSVITARVLQVERADKFKVRNERGRAMKWRKGGQ
jgi:hypothetical protein